jgi:NAD(P)-dependent dehydrogenase (short-subunit alcohol dehydrogenase family)
LDAKPLLFYIYYNLLSQNEKEEITVGKLEGKVAIITGASSGIGQGTAVLFAKEGAKVVVAARGVDGLNETVRMMKEAGGEGMAIRTDTTVEKDMQNLFNTTVSKYGQLNILFNNAGMQNTGKPIHEVNPEDWDLVVRTNLRSTFLGIKYAAPLMFSKGGSIINASSPAGVVGLPFNAAYCASKGGIISLTRAAAYEYAKYKIRVNTFCPGAVETPMLHKAWDGPDGKIPPGLPEGWLKSAPMDYLIKPADVAPGVLFLASDESFFMTGTMMVIDGGFLAI